MIDSSPLDVLGSVNVEEVFQGLEETKKVTLARLRLPLANQTENRTNAPEAFSEREICHKATAHPNG